MPKFTEEQQQAIDREGENILVSAGAGSGKTAVLTERVLRKIKEGISIKQLLILTFTNKAAMEMKERIRKKLAKEHLQDQLDQIDSSYITTFDAFSLAIVKKYSDVFGVSKQVKIMEESILRLKKKEILEEIFDAYYQNPTPSFEHLIYYFCFKGDDSLKEKILSLNEKLDLIIEKEEYLKDYLNTYYNEKIVEERVEEYLALIQTKKEALYECYQDFTSLLEGKYLSKILVLFEPLWNNKSYEEMKSHLDFSLPRLPAGMGEEGKQAKEQVKVALEELQNLCTYETKEEMKKGILRTKDTIKILLEIIQQLDQKLREYKREKEAYTFMDIEKMAIQLVRDHREVREELAHSFQEILIDEYQDTNDVQETFISYIARDNVYMVGDIKQSIYRFRNANPNLFKEKYDRYKKHQAGSIIDLSKNFRSRREVLEDINDLFSHIMDKDIGGAEYQEGHAMIFGNMTYEEKAKTVLDYHMDLVLYDGEDKEYSSVEKEAFLIGDDIKRRMAQEEMVYDKDQDCLRQIEYQDFVILLDRSTDFVKYKQIFEYLGIPLTLWQSDFASSQSDLALIKNLFLIGYRFATKNYDTAFQAAYASLARSFLYEGTDQEIYDTLMSKQFHKTKIYQDFKEIIEKYEELTPTSYFRKVLRKIHYEEKLYKIGNVEQMASRLEYFYHLVENLEALNYSLKEVVDYFTNIMDSGFEIKLALSRPESNSVKIMTIHTSKGLEYPICYFAGFTKKFNESDFKQDVLFDKKYGIAIPDFEGEEDMITKALMLQELKREDISEKIRLFYVALTRAREKIVIVMPAFREEKEKEEIVSREERLQYHSFYDIMKSVRPYFEARETLVEQIPYISKNYLKVKDLDQKKETTKKPLTILPSCYSQEKIEQLTYSKKKQEKQSEEAYKWMELGTKIHTLLERVDFKNKQVPNVENPFLKMKIKAFLEQPFLKKYENYQVYQEYEFIDTFRSKRAHGKIDLLLVGDKDVVVIDYKLMNTVDAAYQKQVKGYKEFLERKTKKPVQCYLYSILQEKFVKIEC